MDKSSTRELLTNKVLHLDICTLMGCIDTHTHSIVAIIFPEHLLQSSPTFDILRSLAWPSVWGLMKSLGGGDSLVAALLWMVNFAVHINLRI